MNLGTMRGCGSVETSRPFLYHDYPGIFPFFSPGIVLSATLMLSGLRRGFNEKNAELCGMSVRFLDRNTSDFDVHRGV